MPQAYCECIYGLGGSVLDPAGGMATLMAKIKALGVITPNVPWDQANIQAVADAVNKHPADAMVFLIGDSCGANKAPWVAAAVYPRKISYMACIQASVYCQNGCPDIPNNVQQAFVIYSDYVHTGGLGCYIPIRAAGNTVTRYRQAYVAAPHPDDNDVANVQNPILADIKNLLDTHPATVAAAAVSANQPGASKSGSATTGTRSSRKFVRTKRIELLPASLAELEKDVDRIAF
ncbi:MAG TPA: hypothetical protein VH206_16960 [Xanthobacteraceae bacterium]|nr:hypothetical protein [Xanthobacteraceae bacterium]